MKKVKFNVLTRLVVLGHLPKEGSIVEMIAVRNLRKKLHFSSEEVDALKLEENEQGVRWNSEAKPVEFEFNDSEVTVLNKMIEAMDSNGTVTEAMLDIIDQLRGNNE